MQEVNPKQVHLLERDDLHILFFKNTLEFCEIPAETADEARPMINANPEYHPTYDFEQIRRSLQSGNLNILQFNISEDCNLRCAYCVAKAGSYGRAKSLMQPETALQGLDRFYSYYTYIQSIQFFGGEPLLNIDTIEAICEYIAERKRNTPEFRAPRLNLNTNGTILNDRVLELIKKHNIQVVISLDGPEEVHDDFRKTAGGEGSFETILKNIHTLNEVTGQPAGIELVYSTHLLEKGWTLLKTMQYLDEILPKNDYTLFVAPMVSDGENPKVAAYTGFSDELLENQLEVIRTGFDTLRQGKLPLFHYNITANIRSLMQRSPRDYFCGIGMTKLMIDAQGDVVPCNALVNKEGCVIGNISEPDVLRSNLPQFQDRFMQLTKAGHFKQCAECWASGLCHFCMAHVIKGNPPTFLEVKPSLCKSHRAIIAELVLQISALSKNQEHWQTFMTYLQNPTALGGPDE